MPPKDKTIDPIHATFEDVTTAMVHQASPKIYKALYQGPLPIEDLELDCAILDDKDNTRVINMTSVFKAFDRVPRSNNRLINIPAFMDAQNLQPFIDQELMGLIKPIEYMDGKSLKVGYNALILPALCDLYLKARRSPNGLTPKQAHLAEKAEILQSSFAKVGMIALIDEATGFQRDRKHDALRLLLSKYIAEGLQKWLHTFPDSFFLELDKLYNNEPTASHKRPQYYGHFINKYVYDPIENGYVKSKLNELNIDQTGKRKARFHQWLSEGGRTILIHQIGRVQMLMEISPTITAFKKVAETQKKVSIAPYLFDEMNQIIQ
jgi:hypothetical protein